MNPTLQTYKDLGVKELSVTNHSAIAVNPYAKAPDKESRDEQQDRYMSFSAVCDLPPLPTSGIKDGIVSIEDVEEEKQWLTEDDECNDVWVKCEPDFICYPVRYALVLSIRS